MASPAGRCTTIYRVGLLPGWGCCQCRMYNGLWRRVCKGCRHRRCALPPLSPEALKALWAPFEENRAACAACSGLSSDNDVDRQTGPRMLRDGWHHPRCPRVALPEAEPTETEPTQGGT